VKYVVHRELREGVSLLLLLRGCLLYLRRKRIPRVKKARIARPPMTPPTIAPISLGREDVVGTNVDEFCRAIVLD